MATHSPAMRDGIASTAAGQAADPRRLRAFVSRHRRDFALPAVLLAEIVLWSILAPSFLTQANLINIIRASSTVGIMAVGMTFVILTAGIDLSVGSLVSFAGMACATTAALGGNALAIIVVALVIGVVSGLVNGVFVAKFHVPPLITTLGMMYVLIAAAQLWNNGGPLPMHDPFIIWLGSGYLGPVPIPVVVLIVVLAIGYWILNQTRFGRHVYAVGGGPEAAKLSGIRIDRVLIGVYVLSGVLAAVASILYTGRLATASPLTGQGLELQVIAAVVVGGASLFGGRGNLRDTFLGVLILTVLQTGLNLIGVSGFWQTMALGIALLVAVLLSPEASFQKTITSLFTRKVPR
ncbi:ABC transporter permease [Leifsonia aquatica]|uniref:Ribose/xylose/arabinose/galactoside ABC-type transport system permease subunit n=2 Tax=Leifsonia aquatica TaxID=144185 RepID=A0A7W4UYI5_LEIAQ|nr:ABC transporter permease [Leifsonia aquatica]MBB2967936.1 ribose/xylose/arabinose/galactoside ABC-type transport system permease subunit [Leifsonia aquatica]